jgi:hypothetical protein
VRKRRPDAHLTSGVTIITGDLIKNTFQAIMLAAVTAQSAESVEQPLHSVILKIMTNYMVAVQVLTEFDISKIEKQPWVVEQERRNAVMKGIEVPNVKIQIPPWANEVKNSLAAFSPAVPAFGVERMIGCLVKGRITRYYARALFHFCAPILNLLWTTFMCGSIFMFRKPIAALAAKMPGAKKKKQEKDTEVTLGQANAPVQQRERILSVWRVPLKEESCLRVIKNFFEDMVPVYIILLMYIWTPVTKRMLYLQQCSFLSFFPSYPTLDRIGWGEDVPEGVTNVDSRYKAGDVELQTSTLQYYKTATNDEPTGPVYWAYASQERWMNDLDMVCNGFSSPDHSVIYAISWAGIALWTFGVVLLAMFMLKLNEDSLHEVAVLRTYGFLYLGYERKYWYWEMIKRGQQLLYRFVSTVNMDVKARLVMYSLFSGAFAIIHVGVQPFDDRDNHKLDWIETEALIIAFTTQVLFQSLITLYLSLGQILTILFIILVINVMIISKILNAFIQELLTHNGKKALDKERKSQMDKNKTQQGVGPAEKAVKKAQKNNQKLTKRLSTFDNAKEIAGHFNPGAWWAKTMLEVGRRVQRKVFIKSRLCLLVNADGHLTSRLIARTPKDRWVKFDWVNRKKPIPPDEPLEVTEDDADFFWCIQQNALEMLMLDFEWDTVDTDLYEFILRLLVALVMHERNMRALDKPIGSKVHIELKQLLLLPTTDVAMIEKRIRTAETEGRTLTFAQACERHVEPEKQIHGDELFRATQYFAVMDPKVLHNAYKAWKKNKLMRVLPPVLREQYEKDAEEPEDAVRRMMTTDPGWMQWTAQMHSQVHETMSTLKPAKKLKNLEGFTKDMKASNKVAKTSNTAKNAPSSTKESKPLDFDNALTNLLSSAAVDQAAEGLYRRSQAQTEAVEELGRARLSNNAPRNHQPYDNRPSNGNDAHPMAINDGH